MCIRDRRVCQAHRILGGQADPSLVDWSGLAHTGEEERIISAALQASDPSLVAVGLKLGGPSRLSELPSYIRKVRATVFVCRGRVANIWYTGAHPYAEVDHIRRVEASGVAVNRAEFGHSGGRLTFHGVDAPEFYARINVSAQGMRAMRRRGTLRLCNAARGPLVEDGCEPHLSPLGYVECSYRETGVALSLVRGEGSVHVRLDSLSAPAFWAEVSLGIQGVPD